MMSKVTFQLCNKINGELAQKAYLHITPDRPQKIDKAESRSTVQKLPG